MIRKQISHLLGSSRDQPGLHVSSTELGKRCTTMSARRSSFKRLWTRMLAWYGRQWVALFPWFESLHAIIFSNITSLGWEGLSLEMEQTTNSVLYHRPSVLLWHFDQIFLWSFQPRCIIIITQMDTEAQLADFASMKCVCDNCGEIWRFHKDYLHNKLGELIR